MEQFSVFMQQHRSQRPRLFSTGSINTTRDATSPPSTTTGSASRLRSYRSSSTVLATEQRSKVWREKAARVHGDGAGPLEPSWNASTLLPKAPTKPLRHQILDKTYQPPAPVYVGASETSELLDRLGKTTVSSRRKDTHRCDPTRMAGGITAFGGLEDVDEQHDVALDTRARDAIQTLLFYRREVEKRLQHSISAQKK